MRNPNRIDPILRELAILWKSQPDTRLGQLIVNLIKTHEDPFYIEDDVLMRRILEALHPWAKAS